MDFRRANIEDIPELNRISYLAKQYWGYPQEWMERWKEDLRISIAEITQHQVVVLEIEANPVGFCVVQEQPDHYEVMHLWVLPTHIGKGYGKQLLVYSLNNCSDPRKEFIVTADPNAEGFYARQGFVTFSQEESYPKGRFLPVMRKSRTS